MRHRNFGYNAATARSMAIRCAKRERARTWFYEENVPKEEIMARLNVSRATVNLYLRTQS